MLSPPYGPSLLAIKCRYSDVDKIFIKPYKNVKAEVYNLPWEFLLSKPIREPKKDLYYRRDPRQEKFH